ncbi:MAG: hypothetical protein COV45_05515 [Deltaproteobacteria bacterium CG11_big_fil_rev_8_21_14_0_20_47_16]|nr:MAG: hypothetical protein COV45_05515 [Deltaproteobacteria bacterium CG11_big_fil_rev_8_21_14_0_20_47_16]
MIHLRVLVPLIMLMLVACTGRQIPKYNAKAGKGGYHTVKPGETLWEIARNNHITAQQIAEWNNIQDPDKVSAGMRIYIPKGRGAGSRKQKRYDAPLAFDRERFQWPVKGYVISGFGMRDGSRHDGVDIKASSGSPIYAAGDGDVVYVGSLRGYGNLIIIRHADRYYTTYAHNSKNIVKLGEHVKAGELIALVGATGRATGPHLHFEVRVGATARNPLFFMPTENNATASAKKSNSSPRVRKGHYTPKKKVDKRGRRRR